MRNKWVIIAAALLACLCLVGAFTAFVLLFQVRAVPLPFLRGLTMQRQAQGQACVIPARPVPGTYHAGPPRSVAQWLVVTYTVECAAPGQPPETINGFSAEDGQGNGCGGGYFVKQPLVPLASSPLTIAVNEGLSQCDGASPSSGLSVVSGYVTGSGAVTAQALFASGPSASAPVQAGRFIILAPNGAAICRVRALDAAGAVLAEQKLGWPGPKATQAACP